MSLRRWSPPIVLLLALIAMPATAQIDRVLTDRVQRLERDLQSLTQQLQGGGGAGVSARAGGPVAPADPSMVGGFQSRLGQFEDEQRRLTGQVEEIGFQVGQLRQRLDRLVTDLDFRLSEIEKKLEQAAAAAPASGAPPRPGQPVPGGVQGPGAPPRPLQAPAGAQAAPGQAPSAQTAAATVRLPAGTTRDQYDFAFDLLRQGKYPEAEQALRAFVAAHPNDAQAGNAQYWLAETFYVRNNMTQAAVEFLAGFQRYPQSPKAPDNLLKLGLSLVAVGKKPEACAVFQRFDRDFPQAQSALRVRVQEERRRNACG
jgi:tol-pal system protein YbgF